MKHLLVFALISSVVLCPHASAQNWRTPNPNQPNGYRATEAAYHYHGSYKEPAQQSNGYRATEARSKFGMSSFAPPTSSTSGSRCGRGEGGRWGSGGERSNGNGSERWGGAGGRFGDSAGRFSGSGQRFGEAEGRFGNFSGGGFQNDAREQGRSEEWNDFYKRRFETTEQGGYNNAGQAQNVQQQYANGQGSALGGNFGGYSQPGQSFGSEQAMRAVIGASAVRQMLRNGDGGNFNRVYGSNEGGFNRVYGRN